MNGFTRQDARRLHVDEATLGRLDRALAIERVAEGVDNPAQKALSDGNVDDGPGPLDRLAFGDAGVVAEDDDADIVLFEVQGHALHPAFELDHLTGTDIVEPVDTGDAVTDRENLADLRDLGVLAEVLDLALENGADFGRVEFHGGLRLFQSGAQARKFGFER